VRAAVVTFPGSNGDRDLARAFELATGRPCARVWHGERELPLADVVGLPGGFSYGDYLRCGAIAARSPIMAAVRGFAEAGGRVLGICNGFQALVKSGWLPGPPEDSQRATLTRNLSNRFECRWVWLEPNPHSPCVFTRGLTARITCPVAHGEGRFVPRDETVLASLLERQQIALTYTTQDGSAPDYPANPNGSTADIAGICNESGNVFGLMPHPEDHIVPEQHPRRTRGERGNLGLALFERGISYAAQV